MSARLLRRVLKEQEEKRLGSSEPDPDLAIDADGDEESGSPPASASASVAASMNPFDLLDDDQVGARSP